MYNLYLHCELIIVSEQNDVKNALSKFNEIIYDIVVKTVLLKESHKKNYPCLYNGEIVNLLKIKKRHKKYQTYHYRQYCLIRSQIKLYLN